MCTHLELWKRHNRRRTEFKIACSSRDVKFERQRAKKTEQGKSDRDTHHSSAVFMSTDAAAIEEGQSTTAGLRSFSSRLRKFSRA